MESTASSVCEHEMSGRNQQQYHANLATSSNPEDINVSSVNMAEVEATVPVPQSLQGAHISSMEQYKEVSITATIILNFLRYMLKSNIVCISCTRRASIPLLRMLFGSR
jgi:hypothetical protein